MIEQNSDDNYYMKKLKSSKNKIMISPCNHKFHIPCLINWMTVKMECPTCRKALPLL